MTHLAKMTSFDYERNYNMKREILLKQKNGFESIQTLPIHCVSANYDMKLREFGYSPRVNRAINPYRLGFKNDNVETHYNFPYECIFITEAQKYLNSRMSMYFPDWQSRWYEQHGHNNLDIYLDTQRPNLIDVNIRELARFIEIVDLTIKNDIFNKPCRLTWTIRVIDNNWAYERYIASGKMDKSIYRQERIVADYNVFDCYNSQSCKPKFYDGHFENDIDYQRAEPFGDNIASYIEYLKKNDDELPDNFYIKRSLKKND